MKERASARSEEGAGHDRAFRIPGGLVTYRVVAEQTGGAYSLFEREVDPGKGTPRHIDHRAVESLYVVEGEFEFVVDGTVSRETTGSLVYVPRGAVHAFRNVGAGTGRLLDLLTPGGPHESFFEEIGEEVTPGQGRAAAPDAPDMAEIARTAAGYGIEILPRSTP